MILFPLYFEYVVLFTSSNSTHWTNLSEIISLGTSRRKWELKRGRDTESSKVTV